jgi:hypothetical protein
MEHVALTQLWQPIVLSAFLVFVVSSIIHMVLKWHAPDYRSLANEDEVRAALRKGNPSAGEYVVPHCSDMKDMASPAMTQKYTEGPNAVLRILKTGVPNVPSSLAVWFGYSLVISLFVAYVASRTLAPGAEYMVVFRIASTLGFMSYVLGAIPESIWMGQPWKSTFKHGVDGLLYGLVTGGSFGWLWP